MKTQELWIWGKLLAVAVENHGESGRVCENMQNDAKKERSVTRIKSCTAPFLFIFSLSVGLLTLRNSSCRTLSSASATVHTSVSINLKMICSLRNSANWTFSFTCSTANTFITNYVCHWYVPSFLNLIKLRLIRPTNIIIQKAEIYKRK